jgi:hypothetical protein
MPGEPGAKNVKIPRKIRLSYLSPPFKAGRGLQGNINMINID